tara:strand:+ start:18303 stop:19214 length:912 start_codon:yes stop_codon:yes gene_type:complete
MKINSNYFKLIISSLVILIIIYSIDINQLINMNFIFNFENISIIFLLLTISLCVRIFRWHILVNHKKLLVNFSTSFKLFFIGQSLNIFLPSGAGDVAKGYYGFKWTGEKEKMFSISLIDKLIAIGSVFFLTPFAYFHSEKYSILIAGFLSIVPFLITYKFKIFNRYNFFQIPFKYLSDRIKKIDLNMLINNFDINFKKIILAFTLSIIGWILTYVILFICIKICNVEISLKVVLSFIPFLVLGRLFPFTLNGIGTDEALIIFLFSTTEIQNESLLLSALLFRIIVMFIPAIVGLFFINKNNLK